MGTLDKIVGYSVTRPQEAVRVLESLCVTESCLKAELKWRSDLRICGACVAFTGACLKIPKRSGPSFCFCNRIRIGDTSKTLWHRASWLSLVSYGQAILS